VIPKYSKGDEKTRWMNAKILSPFFNTKTIVDLFEGSIIKQRCNQDNLNISLGIQSMLTCMYTCCVWNIEYKGNEFYWYICIQCLFIHASLLVMVIAYCNNRMQSWIKQMARTTKKWKRCELTYITGYNKMSAIFQLYLRLSIKIHL
jgi:hypothetical protein